MKQKSKIFNAQLEGFSRNKLNWVIARVPFDVEKIWGTRGLIGSLATDFACNDVGSDEIGRLIAPWIVEGARAEGYQLLPAQMRPVIMNTKGASAAGKSTSRKRWPRGSASHGAISR